MELVQYIRGDLKLQQTLDLGKPDVLLVHLWQIPPYNPRTRTRLDRVLGNHDHRFRRSSTITAGRRDTIPSRTTSKELEYIQVIVGSAARTSEGQDGVFGTAISVQVRRLEVKGRIRDRLLISHNKSGEMRDSRLRHVVKSVPIGELSMPLWRPAAVSESVDERTAEHTLRRHGSTNIMSYGISALTSSLKDQTHQREYKPPCAIQERKDAVQPPISLGFDSSMGHKVDIGYCISARASSTADSPECRMFTMISATG
jgi:hypothetical protein